MLNAISMIFPTDIERHLANTMPCAFSLTRYTNKCSHDIQLILHICNDSLL
jgi:hypothetical protein